MPQDVPRTYFYPYTRTCVWRPTREVKPITIQETAVRSLSLTAALPSRQETYTIGENHKRQVAVQYSPMFVADSAL